MSRPKSRGAEKKPATSPKAGAKSYRTVADLRGDWLLWYKICVLIYDVCRGLTHDIHELTPLTAPQHGKGQKLLEVPLVDDRRTIH